MCQWLCLSDGPDSAIINVTSPNIAAEGETVPNIRCWSECWPSWTNIWTPLSSVSEPSDILTLGTVTRNTTGSYTCTSANTANQYIKNTNKTLNVAVRCKLYYMRSVDRWIYMYVACNMHLIPNHRLWKLIDNFLKNQNNCICFILNWGNCWQSDIVLVQMMICF